MLIYTKGGAVWRHKINFYSFISSCEPALRACSWRHVTPMLNQMRTNRQPLPRDRKCLPKVQVVIWTMYQHISTACKCAETMDFRSVSHSTFPTMSSQPCQMYSHVFTTLKTSNLSSQCYRRYRESPSTSRNFLASCHCTKRFEKWSVRYE